MFLIGMQGWFNIKKSVSVIYHLSRLKKNSHRATSTNIEKRFDKIQYPKGQFEECCDDGSLYCCARLMAPKDMSTSSCLEPENVTLVGENDLCRCH